MARVDFITSLHRSTQRDYLGRVTRRDKAADAEIAGRFGEAYWDGDRDIGYGGYHYDGRWRAVAAAMIEHYGLADDAAILDVGCGKGFLLYEFTRLLPRARIAGVDISDYALAHAKEEVKPFLQRASADALPFADDGFDLVVSINTLHNLYLPRLWRALEEMERVGRGRGYLTVEAYRDEREKVNLMYWQWSRADIGMLYQYPTVQTTMTTIGSIPKST